MPRNVRQAFARGTRSADGKPGRNYWQNRAKYEMTINLRPPDRTVSGVEHITYFNNSPDTLRVMLIKLTLNIHRVGALRESDVDSGYLSTGVHIDSFCVNGEPRNWEDNIFDHTVQVFNLTRPLPRGDSVSLFFKWHFELTQGSGREGVIDSTTYFLAYFYPRVSVYDDYNGWDHWHFNDLQEFYNDFNNYSVTIQVPAGYLTWGTGTLGNGSEVLRPLFYQRMQASYRSDSVIHIVSKADLAGDAITQPGNVHEWRWDARDVTDFAFMTSNHFVWDGAGITVDKGNGRRVSVQAVYNDTAVDFHHAVGFGRHTIGWLSSMLPGLPYPYPAMTIVQGFADMEYPMMINNQTDTSLTMARFLIDHEISHTYFPFYMGIDESRYPFMDEGWVSLFELLLGRSYKPEADADRLFRDWRVSQWSGDGSGEANLPAIVPATIVRSPAYDINAYGKPALAYLTLKDMLGDSIFGRSLRGFMERWHGKHPLPWDMFNSFNSVSGRDLDWFWSNWFFNSYYIDLGIQRVVRVGKGYRVGIQNIGKLAVPVNLELEYTDGSTARIHENAGIWSANPELATILVVTDKQIRKAGLQEGVYLDSDNSNDNWPRATAIRPY
jgi:hypothetical protein